MDNQHRISLSRLTTFAIIPAFFLLVFFAQPPAPQDRTQACLWDSDTLYMEAKGLGSLTEVITGRFDRFPPLYYQMRLDRITALDEATLTLNDYDDAAVACDRLGKGDQAIAWMARKAEALKAATNIADATNPDTADHQYRYLANLGTFHAHRWLRTGTDRTNLADLETARDLIAQAIELNPDAHFGRERYQMLAIEWLLDPPASQYGEVPTIFDATDAELRPRYVSGNLEKNGFKDASAGLAGLIVLGNAWESTDIFTALSYALIDEGNAAIGYLAELRTKEIKESGKRSLHPSFAELEESQAFSPSSHSTEYVLQQIDSYYPRARKEAESWRAARNSFILAKLETGLHPDTNADFWKDWKEPSRPPALPGLFNQYQLLGIASITIIVSFIWLIVARVKRLFPFRKRQQQLPLPT